MANLWNVMRALSIKGVVGLAPLVKKDITTLIIETDIIIINACFIEVYLLEVCGYLAIFDKAA